MHTKCNASICSNGRCECVELYDYKQISMSQNECFQIISMRETIPPIKGSPNDPGIDFFEVLALDSGPNDDMVIYVSLLCGLSCDVEEAVLQLVNTNTIPLR